MCGGAKTYLITNDKKKSRTSNDRSKVKVIRSLEEESLYSRYKVSMGKKWFSHLLRMDDARMIKAARKSGINIVEYILPRQNTTKYYIWWGGYP